jgi:3-oxocholest-4-en-26-oyl-CoA dehydrogenase beta subunit
VNFDLSEEQQVVSDLARTIFEGHASTARVKQVEAGEGIDRELWRELAGANLLGLCLPLEHGGSGMGMVELVLLAEQQGRTVAPVPLVTSTVAAMAVAEFGSSELTTELLGRVIDGSVVLTSALAEPGANDLLRPGTIATTEPDGSVRIRGFKPSVPSLPHAQFVLVPATSADDGVIVAVIPTDAPGIRLEPVSTSNREPQAHLHLDTVVAAHRVLDDPTAVGWLFEHQLVGNAGVQLGVATGAMEHTARHVSTRQQFGRPLSSFQAVTQRAADGYIVTEALRSTTVNAAWRLAEGLDARADALVAGYWASEGAQQVVLGAQHLHGGIGADIDYPVHRHFLWGMQLATALGTASSHLAQLGHLMSRGASR